MRLLRAFLLRLANTSVTLFGAAVIVFVVIRVVPGNPIAMMLPPGATEADIARLEALYGLDKSIFEQFVIWLGGVVQGDFGTSISLRQPVAAAACGGVCGRRKQHSPASTLTPAATLPTLAESSNPHQLTLSPTTTQPMVLSPPTWSTP